MKNNYYLVLLTLFFAIFETIAQENEKYKGDKTFQKTLQINKSVTNQDAIIEFKILYGLNESNTFVSKSQNTDVSGMIHEKYQQYFNGIKVEFGTIILHSLDGQVKSINGELYNAQNLNLKPSISSQQGLDKVLSFLKAQRYMWEDVQSANLLNYTKPVGELVAFPLVNKGEVRLAYKYDVYAIQPLSRDDFYVDAHNGEILFRNPTIMHAQNILSSPEMEQRRARVADAIFTGKSKEEVFKLAPPLAASTAATRYSGNQTIQTDLSGSTYILSEEVRTTNAITGNGMHTYNSNNQATYTTGVTEFSNTTTTWNTGNYSTNSSTKDNAALDAHWGAEKVFDWWATVFNRNSFDNAGAKIKSYVHYNLVAAGQTSNKNAFWNGSVMTYGDGGGTWGPVTSLDVCGHEIGHAVCTYTANLAYQNHSGAMNEGLSDIWGSCIEWWGRNGNFNMPADGASPGTQSAWKIGEDVVSGGLRSMSWPLTKGNPDTYKGSSWTSTVDDGGTCVPSGNSNDNCGVHNNSGVLNHWFYLLTVGKTNWTNNATPSRTTTTTGIGMQKAAQITYLAERDYLTPNATYLDMRNATIAVASNLYCATSNEVQAVTRAWYAVNVGDDFVAPTNDVALKSISGGNINVNCSSTYTPQIIIENGGTTNLTAVTITYNIDGGTNSTINWTGNLANCSQTTQAIAVSGLPRGFHVLNVTTTTASDENSTNNTRSLPIVVNDNGSINVVNSFTNSSDALVSIDSNGKTNTIWERGLVNKSPLTSVATGNSAGYVTKITGNYPDKTRSYLVSQCYNLSNISNPSVSFDMAFDLEENFDVVYFEYSTDNGANWQILGTSTDTNWYNSSRTNASSGTANDCQNCPGKQWTGSYATAPAGGTGVNGNKRNYSHTLSTFGFGGATPASNIIFRFNFVSDDAANQTGVFIDNFVIQGTLATNENQFEEFAVYPNPSNGKFTVKLSTSEQVNLQLFDIRGRSIYSKKFEANGVTFNQELDLSTIASGLYILNVESAGKKEARRIIIE